MEPPSEASGAQRACERSQRRALRELLSQVDKEEAVAKEAQASCEVDEKEAGEAAATANAIKTECQRELDEALPEYYNAIKALDSLDKKDIQEATLIK